MSQIASSRDGTKTTRCNRRNIMFGRSEFGTPEKLSWDGLVQIVYDCFFF